MSLTCQHELMVFHWILRDSKSSQISRTLLSILADLINAVVWMVLTRPPISSSSNPLTKPLRIIPCAPITIGIIVALPVTQLSKISGKVLVPVSFFAFFDFHSVICRDSRFPFFFFLFKITWYGLPVGIRWSVYTQNPREFWASHSPGRILVCVHMVKFQFLAQFPVEHLLR